MFMIKQRVGKKLVAMKLGLWSLKADLKVFI